MAKTPKIKPLGNRVVVRRIEAEEKTAGGIVLPDTAKEKPKQGEVVAVGEGARNDDGERIPMQVKSRDRVVFSSYAATEVTLGGQELLIMKEDDILGIIEE